MRGLNRTARQRAVKEVCVLNNVEMCTLLEMKLNKVGVDLFINNCFQGWKFFINLEAHDGGRILLLWRSDLFEVNLLFSSIQVVHSRIKVLGCSPFLFL